MLTFKILIRKAPILLREQATVPFQGGLAVAGSTYPTFFQNPVQVSRPYNLLVCLRQ